MLRSVPHRIILFNFEYILYMCASVGVSVRYVVWRRQPKTILKSSRPNRASTHHNPRSHHKLILQINVMELEYIISFMILRFPKCKVHIIHTTSTAHTAHIHLRHRQERTHWLRRSSFFRGGKSCLEQHKCMLIIFCYLIHMTYEHIHASVRLMDTQREWNWM